MWNVAGQSRAGSLADLVAVLEDEIIPKLSLLGSWALDLADLQVVQASEVASEGVLMVDADEGASGEGSKIVEATEEVEV